LTNKLRKKERTKNYRSKTNKEIRDRKRETVKQTEG
jgi:hypothetical protein